MKLLLDSHLLLWLLYEPRLVTPAVREALAAAAEVSVSVVSLWELALKHRAGKLPHGPQELRSGVERLNLVVTPLLMPHVVQAAQIELPHQDPFDLMLVAQCRVGRLQLVTADRMILAAGYDTLDAR